MCQIIICSHFKMAYIPEKSVLKAETLQAFVNAPSLNDGSLVQVINIICFNLILYTSIRFQLSENQQLRDSKISILKHLRDWLVFISNWRISQTWLLKNIIHCFIIICINWIFQGIVSTLLWKPFQLKFN